MSPGLQWITQMNLPHTIENPDYKCPVCRKPLIIKSISLWDTDGRVPSAGLQIECKNIPEHSQKQLREWDTVRRMVFLWFDSFYRYRQATPKEVKKRRVVKWRRMA